MPLLKGRFFTSHDVAASAPVVIVDDALVRTLFADADPIGRRIAFEFGGSPGHREPIYREIVGVVHHVRHYGLTSEPPFVQVYAPVDQLPLWFEERRPAMAVVARTSLTPEAVTGSIRREIATIDPDIPVYGVQTMGDYVSQTMEQPRLGVVLLAGFGGLALLLALMGIYGVVAYSVAGADARDRHPHGARRHARQRAAARARRRDWVDRHGRCARRRRIPGTLVDPALAPL